eukprot:8854640-Lingulodinium_polyedra.AAC.1
MRLRTAVASRAARMPSPPCASAVAKAWRSWSSLTACSRKGAGPQKRPVRRAAARAAAAAQRGQRGPPAISQYPTNAPK